MVGSDGGKEDYYFIDGVQYNEEEFRNRAATGRYTFMATE